MAYRVMRASSYYEDPKYRRFMKKTPYGFVVQLRSGAEVLVKPGTLIYYIGKGKFARYMPQKRRKK